VITAGLVPYWCESASARALDGAESWLAGSERFAYVDVLPQPPGTVCGAHAGPPQWRASAWFAERSGLVDREAMRRYPMLPLPTSHAAAVLHRRPRTGEPPAPLTAAEAVRGLRRAGEPLGVLVA
jgi:hypothetical protein